MCQRENIKIFMYVCLMKWEWSYTIRERANDDRGRDFGEKDY